MEKIRNIANTLERQIAMLKLRFWGGLTFQLVLVGAIVYLATRSNYIAIDSLGNAYTAKTIDRHDRQILLIEADAHARSFYSTMWTFTHLNRKTQIAKASHLGGNVIRHLYKALQQKSYYKEIEANNYYVTAEIDSIDAEGFRVNGNTVNLTVFGHMVLENDRFKEMRDLDMQLGMRTVERVRETNPNGMSIEIINIITNSTLQTIEK